MPPLLTLRDIRLGFGGNPLFVGVECSISRGDRACLVGRNGSGKSTLLKVMAGYVDTDGGERFVQPGISMSLLPQEPDLSGYATVYDYVAAGLPEIVSHEVHTVHSLMDEITLDSQADPMSLSGGEKRLAAIARTLVSAPDILLLDEPTNHLDLPTIRWLEEKLLAYRGGFVLISHDRAFLNRLTRVTFWLDRGIVRRLDDGFAAFEVWSETILHREAVETAKFDKLIAQETVWSRQGLKARRARNMGRLRRLQDMRQQRASLIARTGQVKFETESGSVSGKEVIKAQAISKIFEGRTVLKLFSTRILRGDKIGLIGPNGAGKSTLLKILTGQMAPDKGTVRLGANVQMVYLDQTRSALDPHKTVWDTLVESGGDSINVRGRLRHVVGYMRDFLFDDRQVRSPVESLSGGERNRLLLAKALARPSNVLVLDEPTNDLDMDTLDLLQDVLADYDGTLLLVSHDRDFLDRIVTSTIALEGDGVVREYPGGYTDYERQRAKPVNTKPDDKSPKSADRTRGRAEGKPGAKSTKLSYKHQRALEELPKTIRRLEDDIAALEKIMADPDLFGRDSALFEKTAAHLTQKRHALEVAEEEWLETEMLREALL